MNEHEPTSECSNFLGKPESTSDCDEFQIQRFDWDGGDQIISSVDIWKIRMDRYHDLLLATDDGNVRPEYPLDKIDSD